MELSRWLFVPRRNPDASLHLILIPPAGYGTGFYTPWANAWKGTEVEIILARLPGREKRIAEPASEDGWDVASSLVEAVAENVTNPIALFGHSMGALIAYGMTTLLKQSEHSAPRHLFVSGCRAPHVPRREDPMGSLPDDLLLARLTKLGGISSEFLENEELVHLMMPTIRSDVRLSEAFEGVQESVGTVPIFALGGRQDAVVSRSDLQAWEDLTAGPFNLRMFADGHFFLSEILGDVMSVVNDAIGSSLDRNP